jgi:glycosyltransferase involved in cell wall biosynthesis
MSKIIILGAMPESLINFRGDFIRTLVRMNHNVTAISCYTTPENESAIKQLGAEFLPFPIERNKLNPFKDIKTLLVLKGIFHKLQPDVVLAYTIKPVIWGGLAARQVPGIRFYSLIEGLGYAFQGGSLGRNLLGTIARILYKIALRRSAKVIFLNPDNCKYFLDNHLVQKGQISMIDGIGIDLSLYSPAAMPKKALSFLLISRLLGEKGLREYAQAAGLVKKRYPDVTFKLVGPEDPSLDSISLAEIKDWQEKGWVEYLGQTKDVRPYLTNCHVYVLPSYHEGMPCTVMEAMSMGRPILTTDVPGCRETVVEGKNGFLVPKKNTEALTKRMIWFIENSDQLNKMGLCSRQMAEDRFDIIKINQDLVRIMELG